MKNKTIFGAALVGIISLSAFNFGNDLYKADTGLSSLNWTAKKLTGEHTGTIRLTSGEVEIQKDQILGGKFEIDMTSIEDKDLSGEWKAKLENHLKSPDFFDSGKFPTATFVITSVTPLNTSGAGGFTHTVKGNLTIKNKTNPVSFDALISFKNNTVGCMGTAVVDRSKFDVEYGSKSFFPEIGDKIIYDEFTLKFNIIATK